MFMFSTSPHIWRTQVGLWVHDYVTKILIIQRTRTKIQSEKIKFQSLPNFCTCLGKNNHGGTHIIKQGRYQIEALNFPIQTCSSYL